MWVLLHIPYVFRKYSVFILYLFSNHYSEHLYLIYFRLITFYQVISITLFTLTILSDPSAYWRANFSGRNSVFYLVTIRSNLFAQLTVIYFESSAIRLTLSSFTVCRTERAKISSNQFQQTYNYCLLLTK
jgi:hypothetical protein